MGCSASVPNATDGAVTLSKVQHRINKIPLKPHAMPDVVKVASSEDFQAKMTWPGFLGVDVYYSADGLYMYTHSQWESADYAEAAAEALKGVLGGAMKDFIAGPPSPSVGPVTWSYHGKAAGTAVKAVRLSQFTIKPGTFDEMMKKAKESESKFNTIGGLVSIDSIKVSDTKAVIVAKYNAMADLEAAGPKIREVMGSMMSLMAGPPDMDATVLAWTFDNATKTASTPAAPPPMPQHRVNKIPIKPDSFASILAVATSDEFKAKLTWEGFLGVETYKSKDADVMYTHSTWTSADYADAAADALKSVLGGALKEWIAGPPSPTVGPIVYRYKGQASMAPYAAARVTRLALKPGGFAAMGQMTATNAAAFAEIGGLCSIEMLMADDTTFLGLAKYTSMEALEAASAKVGEVMASMKEHMAAPPEMDAVDVAFVYDAKTKAHTTPSSAAKPAAEAAAAPPPPDAAAAAARPPTGATINISYVVPKDKAEEVQMIFGEHSKWMAEFYKDSTEHLISCYFTQAPLFKNPTDPSEGETDSTVFTINEEFASPASVGRHIENAQKNHYFADFAKIMGEYGRVVQPMGSVFFKMDSSRVSGERPATGATINITYVVPKDKAAEVEATFGQHSAWMSSFYADSTEHLISCYFTKAPEFKVPTDPSQGETDNVIFTINEEFTQGESVGRHIGTAKGNDYFPAFGQVLQDYAKVVQPMGQVFFKIR